MFTVFLLSATIGAAPDYDADAALALAVAAASVPQHNPITAFVPSPISGFRAPVGHTHTCANGHSWDHQANPTHTCQFCGLSQYDQDPVPRMVATGTSSGVVKMQGFEQSYSLSAYSSGGCTNGQCSAPQSVGRRGFGILRR